MSLSLSKLPWYGQVAAFGALAAAGAGLFFYYYEKPLQADMTSRQAELKTLRVDIVKGQATAKKLPEFRAEVEELDGRLKKLQAVLPEEKDAADLLRRMQTVAMQSNLTITSFKPAPVVTKELHVEWPINLELLGNYHNLATFFDRLGKFTRIVNISGIDVKGKEKDKNQADSATTIAAKCVATTFVLLDKPAAPKTTDKKAGARPAAPKKVA